AAALATLRALREEDAVAVMRERGQALRDGLAAQAARWEVPVRQTGPPAMPFLSFGGDRDFRLANVFTGEAIRRGAFLHPRHNWFVSAAMTGADLEHVLAATDRAFAAVRAELDSGG
ncbi:MAG: glutamate-1-semialdehyde 2,1-aminomutase, partial [Gemmatimonadota bacterium]